MKLIAVALIAAVAFAAPVASAQQTTKQANPAAEETPDFLHLSGIMAQQQMRHIKLWFAGAAGNWPLADYEIDGLKEGFDDVAKLLGDDIAQQRLEGACSERAGHQAPVSFRILPRILGQICEEQRGMVLWPMKLPSRVKPAGPLSRAILLAFRRRALRKAEALSLGMRI